MIFLWILVGILVFLFLLFLIAMLTVRFTLECREEITLTCSFLFIKRTIIPAEQESTLLADLLELKRRPKKKQKRTQKQLPTSPSDRTERKEVGVVELLFELCDLLLVLLKNSRGHLTVRTSRIRILVATGDAASTAVLFGAVNGAVVSLLEILDRFWKLKTKPKDELEVRPDYLAETTTVDIRMLFSLRIWQIVYILYKAIFT